MKTLLVVLIVAIVAVAAMIAGLGLKMLTHKSDEFRRPCVNADPRTGRCANCKCHEIKQK
ncbi:MAG: hypothetical protein IJ789_05330 [Bacteroidales bacterium]|nr:hypothetical protein [Bacteroidales bacterium]